MFSGRNRPERLGLKMRTCFFKKQSLKAVLTKASTFLLAAVATIMSGGVAHAVGDGQPVPWQMDFQEPVTAIARQIGSLHDFLMIVITLVTLFVVALLAYIAVKFNEKANPVPSTTSHHTLLEVIWTTAPILILLVIVVPSFRLLFAQYDFPKADVVIKATGNQWNWSYEYPDQGGLSFDAVMLRDDDQKPIKGPNGEPRILAVDNYVVVPVNKNVEVLVTASDVIHAWAVPAFGVKVDAVPRSRCPHLVQCRYNRHLLWSVFRALWQRPCLHAYWRQSREPAGLYRLAGQGQKRICCR